MAAKDFEELVRNRMKGASDQFDWAPRKAWWLEAVKSLMGEINEWLAPLSQEKLIQFSTRELDVTEEQLGTYTTLEGVVTLDNMTLKVSPKGTVILGGYGRIDVVGPNGSAMLVLVDEGVRPTIDRPWEQSKWYITRPSNRRQLAEVNEASFKQLMADLFGLGA